MLRSNYIKLIRFTLLKNSIVSSVDICKENYVKNDVIIVEKRGVLQNDYKFYDEYVCGYTYNNDNLVYLDKNEYIENKENKENKFGEDNFLIFYKKK